MLLSQHREKGRKVVVLVSFGTDWRSFPLLELGGYDICDAGAVLPVCSRVCDSCTGLLYRKIRVKTPER